MLLLKPMYLCVYVCLAVVLSASGTNGNEINYHLKWVSKEPILPIFLEKRFPQLPQSAKGEDEWISEEYRWYKYPHNVYVDEVEDSKSAYMYSSAVDRAILYIVEYNVRTHEQLASYEPRVVVDGRRTSSSSRTDASSDLFTLAYLDGHSIVVTDSPNDLVAHCNVSILMPNNNPYLNGINLKLVEKNVNLSFGFVKPHHHHHHHSGPNKTNGKNQAQIIGKNRVKRSSIRKSFVQVNLDIGPILIPKAQLLAKNNPELTCTLDLLDIEQDSIVERYRIKKPIDDALYLLDRLHQPPAPRPPQQQPQPPVNNNNSGRQPTQQRPSAATSRSPMPPQPPSQYRDGINLAKLLRPNSYVLSLLLVFASILLLLL